MVATHQLAHVVAMEAARDGVKGVAFVTACIESGKKNGGWVKL